eukprot:CAMPEP_0196656174 /NCGR_PEP_ID=MMETSP1086-20130531/13636_1 /TAXON_ID=77921 /ORGANISM="Cyanoptyche  gloeocystis , Strain SAG4.97" /LENGTH=82 /DNA_ID=CAMNT_0041988805 /DNA_START=413 /DNA_END=657 /DNA_ORIENTATION=-
MDTNGGVHFVVYASGHACLLGGMLRDAVASIAWDAGVLGLDRVRGDELAAEQPLVRSNTPRLLEVVDLRLGVADVVLLHALG